MNDKHFDARHNVVTQTSEPDPFDGGCPADTLNPYPIIRIPFPGGERPLSHTSEAEQLRADNARLTELNANLKTAIREADASIKRMLGEIDVMVAKLMEAGK